MTDPSIPDRPQSPSERVVRAVADHRGVSPEQLDEPLYSAIDPDALDILFARRPGETTVLELEFIYHGHRVTVESDGSVTVSDQS
jgi:hypothetical protein